MQNDRAVAKLSVMVVTYQILMMGVATYAPSIALETD